MGRRAWVEDRPQKEESFLGVLGKNYPETKEWPQVVREEWLPRLGVRGLGLQSFTCCAHGQFLGLGRDSSKVGNEQPE